MTIDNSERLLHYQSRVAMWHEAGHAIAAMHYGRKIFSYGTYPIPHCMVNSFLLNNEQKGILLCAGAAMTKIIYGYEWGGDCTDWKMAEGLGDIEHFKTEAEKLCRKYLSEAKYLVEYRMGTDESLDNWEPSREEQIRDMDESSPIYEQTMDAAENAHFPEWLDKALHRYAMWQIKYPRFAALIAKICP